MLRATPKRGRKDLQPRDRAPYSAIVDRPPLRLPQGVRLVVWPIVNLEVWEIERPMARQVLPAPTGVAVMPDVANWSWHEYGMRVGVWRFFAAFDRVGARATLSINAEVVDRYRRVAEAARERRWEFMGHSEIQMPIHQLADQRATIARALDRLEAFTGTRPRGWLGPGLTETFETPDLLTQAGVQYIGDWVYDDEPTVIATAHGPLVTLPYTVELNDIPLATVQHHASDVFLARARDQFDRLYAEGAARAKILSLAIHPYITGVPHRIKYLEAFLAYAQGHDGVQFWTGDEILDWYRGAISRTGP
jgi:allantoinase